jgi:hypothetical protein
MIKIKEDEMGGPCGTHGADEKYIQHVIWKPRKEGLGMDGRRILE